MRPALVGLAVFTVALSTTIPMPLYTAYASRSGAGAGGLAMAFVAYAGTVIITAPLLGALSDRIGRKPCMILGLLLAAVSIILLIMIPSLAALGAARMLQGLATGVIAGAGTAWAAELGAGGARAASITAAGTAGGFGIGGLITLGALLLAPGAEPPFTYWLHLAVSAVALASIAWLPETRAGPRGPWLRLPAFPRGTLASTLGMLPAWGTTGVMLTAIPAALAAQGSPRLGPFAVCVMILVGVVVQPFLRGVAAGRAVLTGLVLMALGDGLAVWGTLSGAVVPLLAGGAVIGSAAYGFLFLGGLSAASAAATPELRARAAAGFFLVAHIGFALPPLLTGLAVDAFGAGVALPGHVLAVVLAGLVLAPFLRDRAKREGRG
ncbi:MAG: MFS transporter [Pseudomonadota bacterium]